MMSDASHMASAQRLQQLTILAPDRGRAERVRVRCRAQLERSTRRAARASLINGFASGVLVPALVGAFCVLYVAVLVAITLRLQGI